MSHCGGWHANIIQRRHGLHQHQAHLRRLQPCGGALNLGVQLVQQLALHQGAASAKASGSVNHY